MYLVAVMAMESLICFLHLKKLFPAYKHSFQIPWSTHCIRLLHALVIIVVRMHTHCTGVCTVSAPSLCGGGWGNSSKCARSICSTNCRWDCVRCSPTSQHGGHYLVSIAVNLFLPVPHLLYLGFSVRNRGSSIARSRRRKHSIRCPCRWVERPQKVLSFYSSSRSLLQQSYVCAYCWYDPSKALPIPIIWR